MGSLIVNFFTRNVNKDVLFLYLFFCFHDEQIKIYVTPCDVFQKVLIIDPFRLDKALPKCGY